MPFTMNLAERQAKADDLIGFLAAFDTSHSDACDILSQAYQKCTFLKEDEYKATGKNLASFVQLFGQQKPQ